MDKSRSSAGCHVAVEPAGRLQLVKKNQTLISNEDLKWLVAANQTLTAVQVVKTLCPQCGKFVLVEGWQCFGCGYDKDDDDED